MASIFSIIFQKSVNEALKKQSWEFSIPMCKKSCTFKAIFNCTIICLLLSKFLTWHNIFQSQKYCCLHVGVMHHSSPLQSPSLLCEGRENTDNVDNLYVVRHSAENANLNTVNEELNMQQRPSKVHKNLNNRYWKCFEYPLTPGQVMMGKGRLYWFCESKQWPSPRLHCTLQERCRGAGTIMLLLQLFYILCSAEK